MDVLTGESFSKQSDEFDVKRELGRLLMLRYGLVRPKSVPEEGEVVLTPREHDCLLMAAKGFSYPEIAGLMGISRSTVKFHLANAREKLDTVSTVEAVARAVVLGLIVP